MVAEHLRPVNGPEVFSCLFPSLPCERCDRDASCSPQELHVLRANVCGPCRTADELRALATEVYLDAEYEVARMTAQGHGFRPDGSPGPKLAQAMALRDHHLAKFIGGPVMPAPVPEVRPEPRRLIPKPIHKAVMVFARRTGILRR